MSLLLTMLMLAALVFLPAPASAFDLEENLKAGHVQYEGTNESRVTQSGCMSLAQATEAVRRRTGGQVIDARTRVQGGREVHHIKVLKDGKVRTHKVNGCRLR